MIASTLMMTGVIIMAFGLDLSGRVSPELQPWCIVIGVTIVGSGVLTAGKGFYSILDQDSRTLILQADGIKFVDSDEHQFVAWQDVEKVSFHKNEITVLQRSGEPLVICESFLGISTKNLVEQIKETQRKALLGIPC